MLVKELVFLSARNTLLRYSTSALLSMTAKPNPLVESETAKIRKYLLWFLFIKLSGHFRSNVDKRLMAFRMKSPFAIGKKFGTLCHILFHLFKQAGKQFTNWLSVNHLVGQGSAQTRFTIKTFIARDLASFVLTSPTQHESHFLL